MMKIDPGMAVETAIASWRSLDDLVQFALDRHGYGNSDSGIGVTYANDLDDHDRLVEGCDIPEGHVEIYYFWGPPDGYEIQIPEWMYRNFLADYLRRAGRKVDARRVRVKPGWGLSTGMMSSSQVSFWRRALDALRR